MAQDYQTETPQMETPQMETPQMLTSQGEGRTVCGMNFRQEQQERHRQKQQQRGCDQLEQQQQQHTTKTMTGRNKKDTCNRRQCDRFMYRLLTNSVRE